MERRIIIRGIQPSPPSFLSSILSVGLGLPRVTLSSNGISDPSSSSSFDFTTRLRILSTFAFTDTHAAPPPPPPPPPPRPRPFSFSSLLLPPFFPFSTLSRALYVTLRNTERMYIRLCGYAFENLTWKKNSTLCVRSLSSYFSMNFPKPFFLFFFETILILSLSLSHDNARLHGIPECVRGQTISYLSRPMTKHVGWVIGDE